MKIVIADDHPVVLVGTRAVLRQSLREMQVVGAAMSGRELLGLLKDCDCDVLVTDFSMPSPDDACGDGMALLRMLRRRHPRLPIVVMTVLKNQAILLALLRLGVTGLVEKASPSDELTAAVESAAAGKRYVSRDLRERLDDGAEKPAARLSPREIEVVRLFVSGMSMTEIAAHLNRTIKTVSRQKGDAMRKLRVENHSELYAYACSNGLLS